MDASDNLGSLNHMVEAVALDDASADESGATQKDTSLTEMLRIKQQMFNQCFEMEVQLNAGKSKRSCSTSEAERDLPDLNSELEQAKSVHFNDTIALHRMQTGHTIGEQMKQSDPEAVALKVVTERCMELCSRIKQLQQDTRYLQDEITKIQKSRLEMKRLTHEKMKEMEDLMSKKELPDPEQYKAVLEKGQANLEKYKKMVIMTQNVVRGILLSCKVNWLDDPKLREIAMALEEFPISE